jgi:hypothetical protein
MLAERSAVRAGGHRLKEAQRAVQVRAIKDVVENQKSQSPGSDAGIDIRGAENLSDRDRGRNLIAKSRIEVPSSEVPIQPEQNAQDPRSTRPDLVADWGRVPSPPNSESRVGSSRSRAEAPAGPAGRAWWQIFHNPRFTPMLR